MNVELEAALPFDQWPQEIQDRYAYDPEAAEKLLDGGRVSAWCGWRQI